MVDFFKNYLRNQHLEEKKTNFISYNLIIEAANLISLVPSHKQAIISETLEALVEFIIGPCAENQQILCKNINISNHLYCFSIGKRDILFSKYGGKEEEGRGRGRGRGKKEREEEGEGGEEERRG